MTKNDCDDSRDENRDSDVLFGFCHGIRLALESQGKSICNAIDIRLLLGHMERIVAGDSIVSAHDELSQETVEHHRDLERGLCVSYLELTAEKNS